MGLLQANDKVDSGCLWDGAKDAQVYGSAAC